jgi:hypothetical protein
MSVFSSFWDWKFGLGYFLGYTFHRWCDNDLDLMGVSGAEGRMVNELPIIGHIFFGASSAYGSWFRKKHRSFLTHFPVVSTIIRLIFFFSVPFILLDGWGVNLIGNGWVWLWVGFLAGLSHADTIHYYHDLMNTKE